MMNVILVSPCFSANTKYLNYKSIPISVTDICKFVFSLVSSLKHHNIQRRDVDIVLLKFKYFLSFQKTFTM